MGLIRVTLDGSFQKLSHPHVHEESAMDSGHAIAVANLIGWLSDVVLPKAIRLDHQLHEQRSFPRDRFLAIKAQADES